MPNKPKRLCSRCRRGKVDPATNVCDRCGPAKRRGWKHDQQRGTRQQRGYDQTWINLRAYWLRLHPLCEDCKREGQITAAEEVHHMRAFRGPDDPLRLDDTNLESLCKSCHSRKTAKGAAVPRGGGVSF